MGFRDSCASAAIPPFYTAGGDESRVGRGVFVNQNCTFYDQAELDSGDNVTVTPPMMARRGEFRADGGSGRSFAAGGAIVSFAGSVLGADYYPGDHAVVAGRGARARLRQFVRFHLSIGLASMFGNLVLMRLLVHEAHLPVLVSNVAAIACCSLGNFRLGNNWVFARSTGRQ